MPRLVSRPVPDSSAPVSFRALPSAAKPPTFGLADLICAVVLCAGLAATAFAQEKAPEKLLKGKAVTEGNLLDALTPEEEPVVMRSLRVSPDAQPAAPRKKPSAALLITFATNSATLEPRSKQQLDVVAQALRNDRLKDFSFNVEGHADPRGNSEVNRELSQARAESVRQYLISQHNIPESRLKAVGKGDGEPLNARDPSAAENRRVTIVTNVQ